MKWQPIETAPRVEDGYVLACRAGSLIPMVAGWDETGERWYAFNGAFRDDWEPTHWMPLPSPPPKVAMGKRAGGLARAAALSPERRSEIAQKAASERWSEKKSS